MLEDPGLLIGPRLGRDNGVGLLRFEDLSHGSVPL
jgi:hypothetical protein